MKCTCYYSYLNTCRDDLPAGYPLDATVGFNEHIAYLIAEDELKIGPAKLLAVNKDDRIQGSVSYFYTEDAPGASYNHLGTFVQEVLISLVSAATVSTNMSEAMLLNTVNGTNHIGPQLTQFLAANMDTTDMSRPHGYMVYLAYDNQFNLVDLNSGARRVENPNDLHQLLTQEITIARDGFLHVYVSNGSSEKGINFDNFLITAAKGKTRQINHYYPYGLRISGMDGYTHDYKNMYTSKELQTGEFDPALSTGLEMYDFIRACPLSAVLMRPLRLVHARFYDPQLGRWFAPDPAEQFHNPYLAMGNNPVMYVDPDGEFIGTVVTTIFDFYRTGFTNGGFEFWNWNKPHFRDAWREFDPTAEWSRSNKAFKIDIGMFKTDSDKNGIGRAWQLGKRLTWQLPNTLAGNGQSHWNNIRGRVQRVDYFHGSTVVYGNRPRNGGSSVGGYINIGQFDRFGNAQHTDYGNALLLHEYGHYLQEQAFGPFTIFSGLNSMLSTVGDNDSGRPFNTVGSHDRAWFEQDANARAVDYFSRKEKFNEFYINPALTARQNFDDRFSFQRKSRRFWWYMPPFTLAHIFYTAFINTGL